MGAAEGEELDGLWSSLLVFILLFLLSVTYSASVTLIKVGRRPAGRGAGGPRGTAGWQPSRPPSSQVKWVVGAILQKTAPPTHDYANVEPRAAWARGRSCTGPAALLPASRHH